jgi:hypothetical protein
MRKPTTPDVLPYASSPYRVRRSKLAVSALIVSLAVCPLITGPLTSILFGWRMSSMVWLFVLVMATAWALLAVARVAASDGRVSGSKMAWWAVVLPLFWFLGTFIVGVILRETGF